MAAMRASAVWKPLARAMRALTWAFSASAPRVGDGVVQGVVDGRPVPGQGLGKLDELGDPAAVGPGDHAAERLLPVGALDVPTVAGVKDL
jgi:hypothetical protein